MLVHVNGGFEERVGWEWVGGGRRSSQGANTILLHLIAGVHVKSSDDVFRCCDMMINFISVL